MRYIVASLVSSYGYKIMFARSTSTARKCIGSCCSKMLGMSRRAIGHLEPWKITYPYVLEYQSNSSALNNGEVLVQARDLFRFETH